MKQIFETLLLAVVLIIAFLGLITQRHPNAPLNKCPEPTPITQTELSPKYTLVCVQGLKYMAYNGELHKITDYHTKEQEVCE